MDLWYTDLVLATLVRFLWSESHLAHDLNTPCKYGPPWCSHLGGDSIRATGFIVYIPQRLVALAFGLPSYLTEEVLRSAGMGRPLAAIALLLKSGTMKGARLLRQG